MSASTSLFRCVQFGEATSLRGDTCVADIAADTANDSDMGTDTNTHANTHANTHTDTDYGESRPYTPTDAWTAERACAPRWSQSAMSPEAGALMKASPLERGGSYTSFVVQHDGVRNRVRVPAMNGLGSDVGYGGGLCADVIAPGGMHQDSDGVQGCFGDALDQSRARPWPKPQPAQTLASAPPP